MSTELTLLSRVAYRGREITGPRLRGLLALLAGDLRTGAGTARLVDGLWPDEQPENPTKALQILVSRIRAQLGPEVLLSTPTGYRLALGEDQVDSSAVLLSASASARHSRAGDHAAALAHAEAGLALWDGVADRGGLDDPLSALRAERASAHRSLVRARALALARLGRRAEAAEPLAELADERPRDEEILLELLRCEAETVGPAAALSRYEIYRRALRDDLGTDPGPALQAVYRQLLDGETPSVRQGVAHEPNPLLGRAGDIAAVTSLLATSRVVSIVGPGGLGKTRLANVVSRQAEQRVVHLVGLAGVTTDEDVAGEVSSALGVGEPRHALGVTPDVVGGIAGALGPGPSLLVLDNCEHVIRGAADLVRALVSITRDVRVLTTSRAPLGLSSESVYPLPELDLPTAVELFEQRARAARPGIDLPAPLVSELCAHLDGLPLAVELAAARVRVMSVAEIARRLEDRFTLLRGGSRDAPERHRTLQAVVDWSWNLLEPDGQAAMRALSIFPGGFTADAAARLLADGDVVEQLVDQSLLKVLDTPSGTRFQMLETVREFSTARREEAGETARVTTAFLAWARDFGVARHDAPLGLDPYQPVAAIRAEQDNLVQALRMALRIEDAPTVAATQAVLTGLWMWESNFTRLEPLNTDTAWLLSHYRPEPELVEATRATLTLSAAYSMLVLGPRATRALVALRRLPPAPPDTVGRAAALVLAAAPKGLAELQVWCDSDEPLVSGAASAIASYLWEGAGDHDKALKAAKRTIETFKSPWPLAAAHARIAELYLQVDLAEEARRHMLAALPVYERLNAWSDVAGLRWWMVLASLRLGALDEAEHWLEQTSPGADDAVISQTYGLGVRAEIMLARGEVDTGLRLWRRSADLLRTAEEGGPNQPGLQPWVLEVRAVTVVAHAQHGRLDLVEELTGPLPDTLSTMLANPAENPPPFVMELPIAGALLLALAMVDLDRGEHGSGVRMIALAERFRFLRGFQPTMSAARAREAAENADRSTYHDAVSSYADLDRDALPAAALAVLRART